MTDKERLAQLEAELAQYKGAGQTATATSQTAKPAAVQTAAPTAYKAPAPTPVPLAPAPVANNGYTPGANVNTAYQQYLSMFNAQPGAYQSQWQPEMTNLYNQMANRKPFEYDMNGDMLYQQMKDQYIRNGQLGMQNTMGQASAMTGGYGNSWAQTAGQQTYDSYMQELNNNLPQLYDRAYGKYQDQGQEMAQRFGMAGQMEGIDYGQYRDQVGDWQWGTGTALGQYNQEYGNDYGAFSDKRSADFAREQFDWEKAWNQQQFDYQKQQDDYAKALAAANAGGGGGRGRSPGKAKELLPEHEFAAYDRMNSGGINSADSYLYDLEKQGYDSNELMNLRRKIQQSKIAFQPKQQIPGVGAGK